MAQTTKEKEKPTRPPIRKFESTARAQYADKKNGLDHACAWGYHVDLTRVPEDDVELRESTILDCGIEAKLRQPILATELSPMQDLQIVFPDEAGRAWVDLHNGKNDKQSAMMLLACHEITDTTKLIPDKRLGEFSKGESVMRVNGALPVHLWFRAANIQILVEHPGSNVRVVPFPVIRPVEAEGRPATEFQDEEIVYRAIISTPTEYDEWFKTFKRAAAAEGIEAGFHTAARCGYMFLISRIRLQIDEYNGQVRVRNNMKNKAAGPGDHVPADEPQLPAFDVTKDQIREYHVDRWTTEIIIRRESYLRGALIEGWVKEDFDKALEKSHHIYI